MSRAAAAELLPAAVQGRGRRRRGHRRCARSTRSTACRAARTSYTETHILKERWGFDGFIESDYTAVAELRACPPREPGRAARAATASPPTAPRPRSWRSTPAPTPRWSRPTTATSASSWSPSGRVSMQRIDDAVRRILRVKFRAGLFEHPYVDVDAGDGQTQLLPAEPRRGAQGRRPLDGAAQERRPVLPLDPAKSTAVIGPLRRHAPARHARPVVGRRATTQDAVSLFDGIKAAEPEHDVHAGLHAQQQRARRPRRTSAPRRPASRPRSPRPQAADQVVLALGETREMSGEAEARSNLDLPGRQEELIDAIKATGKPFAVVLFNGRPLTLDEVDADVAGDPRGLVRRRRGRQRASPTCCSARSTRAASCR